MGAPNGQRALISLARASWGGVQSCQRGASDPPSLPLRLSGSKAIRCFAKLAGPPRLAGHVVWRGRCSSRAVLSPPPPLVLSLSKDVRVAAMASGGNGDCRQCPTQRPIRRAHHRLQQARDERTGGWELKVPLSVTTGQSGPRVCERPDRPVEDRTSASAAAADRGWEGPGVPPSDPHSVGCSTVSSAASACTASAVAPGSALGS